MADEEVMAGRSAPARPATPTSANGRARPVGDLLTAAAQRFRRIDARNTWQLAAGAVLLPLGVVLILLSWYGSAHTPYVQQQIPYLVSGSFVGLGLMVVGGLLFWAHWLYRIYDQADLHHAEMMGRQEELFARLADAMGAGPDSSSRNGRGAGGRPAAAGATDLVATASGNNVHRADCPIVARHPDGLRRVSAEEAGDRPACRICQPALHV